MGAVCRGKNATAAQALEAANESLQQQLEQLQGKYSHLEIKYHKLKAARNKLKRDAKANTISKTKGEHRRDFNLHQEMGLGDPGRKGLYLSILLTVRHLVDQAGLDPKIWFRHQDPIKMAQIYAVARNKFPLLKQFQGDWATAEIVKQVLRNRRHCKLRNYMVVYENEAADDAMDDEDSDSSSSSESEKGE
ncbi:hypothetical protein BOTBODRAFT_174370 [Botryobasidium botryosum FD-172 SS1]|uniref:Uncharacterized protein n=1 Tax=Botryobasidium botryosum (strain FD-172 SS1) TaxID=930990 RepID=A0A067MH71_BOTB1|nr:hypothetical protein BOTBODRAFT_174370 [Botryobasidium botryosum FD-172 SS1]